MALGTSSTSRRVIGLLSEAQNPTPKERVFYFKGDLCQMAKATDVASKLGIKTGVAGGIPYVTSKEDYNKVTSYIVLNKLEGYWHYE